MTPFWCQTSSTYNAGTLVEFRDERREDDFLGPRATRKSRWPHPARNVCPIPWIKMTYVYVCTFVLGLCKDTATEFAFNRWT